MGYAQELQRWMSRFSNFAISFSIICILSGGINSLRRPPRRIGGAGAGIGWIVGCLVSGFFALAMAQISSAYPTAGGLYHWASILGNRVHRLAHRLAQPAWPDHRASARSTSAPRYSSIGTFGVDIRHRHGITGQIVLFVAIITGAAGAAQSFRHQADGHADRRFGLPDLRSDCGPDRRMSGLCSGHRHQRGFGPSPTTRAKRAATYSRSPNSMGYLFLLCLLAADLHHHRL